LANVALLPLLRPAGQQDDENVSRDARTRHGIKRPEPRLEGALARVGQIVAQIEDFRR
jgi:hypothetical protein